MKEEQFNRSLHQYQEIFNIDDKDEFLHCFTYELAIRSIKDYLIDRFSNFKIINDELTLTIKGIEAAEELLKNPIYDELKGEIAKDNANTALQKSIELMMTIIEDELQFELGLSLEDLYVDYNFFNDDFKKIFFALFKNSEWLFINKKLYNGTLESEAYFNEKFIRTHTYFPKMRDDDFRDIKTHYTYRYKRPLFHGTILSNNKKADITINTDLSKEVIMQQVAKLVDIMKKDSKSIYSNRDKVAIADNINNYQKSVNEVYKNKRLLIDGLIIFDYIEARTKEAKDENQETEKIKKQKIDFITKSLELKKDEKREQIKQINASYSKITRKRIKEEIAERLSLSYDTIEKYYKTTKNLLDKKNFLKLIEGKDTKTLFSTLQ